MELRDWIKLVEAKSSILDGEVSELINSLEAQHPGLDLWMYISSGGNLVLSKIVVPKDQRSAGVGTAVMEVLTAFADKQGIPITLTPDNAYGGSVTRLQTFYRRFGFKPNKGRSRDYRYSETMIRRPK